MPVNDTQKETHFVITTFSTFKFIGLIASLFVTLNVRKPYHLHNILFITVRTGSNHLIMHEI